ncbi:MAG: hypothetical protein AAFX53_08055 [Bacteroidota bacterium]
MRKEHKTLWNGIVAVTVIVCLLALLSHYKNWVRTNSNGMKILSGFYYKNIPFSDLDSVQWAERIPPMERLNGFSALGKEKGIFREFKDSLTDKKVYVYVDNLSHQKIKLVYRDSVKLFMNLKDSTDTDKMYQLFKDRIDAEKE